MEARIELQGQGNQAQDQVMAEANDNQDNLAWLNDVVDIVVEGARLASSTRRSRLGLIGGLIGIL